MKKYKEILKVILSISIIAILFSCSDNLIENDYDPPTIKDTFDFRLVDYEPSWSPDGNYIAYVHGDTLLERTGIYLYNLHESNSQLLIAEPSANTPSWTPDCNWIVFEMYSQIWKIKVNGDSLTQLTFEGRNFFPFVNPNGEWIVFDSNKDSPNGMNFIWKMSIDGTSETRIAYEPDEGEIRMPFWGANEQIIHLRYSQDYSLTEIFQMTPDGLNIKRITFNETTDTYPQYSLRKNKIAYTSQAEGKTPQIWIIDFDGSNAQQLTETQGYTCSWSPDGNKIVYTDSRVVNGYLWIMNSDGSNPQQLTF